MKSSSGHHSFPRTRWVSEDASARQSASISLSIRMASMSALGGSNLVQPRHDKNHGCEQDDEQDAEHLEASVILRNHLVVCGITDFFAGQPFPKPLPCFVGPALHLLVVSGHNHSGPLVDLAAARLADRRNAAARRETSDRQREEAPASHCFSEPCRESAGSASIIHPVRPGAALKPASSPAPCRASGTPAGQA